MYVLIIVLTLLAAVLLIGVVLIQKSKGGGLSSSFAGSNQIMGVRRTNDFIEKATWTLASIIAILAIVSTFVLPTNSTVAGSRVKAPAAAPVVEGTEYSTTPVLEIPAAADSAVATEAPAAE